MKKWRTSEEGRNAKHVPSGLSVTHTTLICQWMNAFKVEEQNDHDIKARTADWRIKVLVHAFFEIINILLVFSCAIAWKKMIYVALVLMERISWDDNMLSLSLVVMHMMCSIADVFL